MQDEQLKQSARRVHEYLQNAPASIQDDAQAVIGELFRARAVLEQLTRLQGIYADYHSLPPRVFWGKHPDVLVPFYARILYKQMLDLIEKHQSENALPGNFLSPALSSAMQRVVEAFQRHQPNEIRAGVRVDLASGYTGVPAPTLCGMPVAIDESLPPNEIRFIHRYGGNELVIKFDVGGRGE